MKQKETSYDDREERPQKSHLISWGRSNATCRRREHKLKQKQSSNIEDIAI